MFDFSRVQNYYIACGYTDMRKQIDGLVAVVELQFGQKLEEKIKNENSQKGFCCQCRIIQVKRFLRKAVSSVAEEMVLKALVDILIAATIRFFWCDSPGLNDWRI